MEWKVKVKNIIREAQCRSGYYHKTAKVCDLACIDKRTFARRLDSPWSLTLGELRRLNRVIKFTDEEIREILK